MDYPTFIGFVLQGTSLFFVFLAFFVLYRFRLSGRYHQDRLEHWNRMICQTTLVAGAIVIIRADVLPKNPESIIGFCALFYFVSLAVETHGLATSKNHHASELREVMIWQITAFVFMASALVVSLISAN